MIELTTKQAERIKRIESQLELIKRQLMDVIDLRLIFKIHTENTSFGYDRICITVFSFNGQQRYEKCFVLNDDILQMMENDIKLIVISMLNKMLENTLRFLEDNK